MTKDPVRPNLADPKQPAGTVPEVATGATGPVTRPKEIGGPKGPEPTRYGDWERNGRVSDF